MLQTIGELFLVLREMGFAEDQIQAAVQAGHFSVSEAAEWWVEPAPFSLFSFYKMTALSECCVLSYLLIGSYRVNIHDTH